MQFGAEYKSSEFKCGLKGGLLDVLSECHYSYFTVYSVSNFNKQFACS